MSKYVIDIECVGLPDAADYAEPVQAPSNWKDEAKIAAYVAEKNAEQVAKAALDLDLCRVVAIGVQEERASEPMVFTTEAFGEDDMLDELWSLLAKDRRPTLIGFNHLSYDLPVLFRRSQYLGLSADLFATVNNLDKYRTPHIDLMQVLTWRGLVRARSLKFYAKRFGIPVTDTIKGSDIPALVEAGDWESVRSHVTSDVKLTMALGRKLGVLEPEQAPNLSLVF